MGTVIVDERAFSAYEAITVADASIGFTAGTIKPTSGDNKGKLVQIAECRLETAQIRFLITGGTPSATAGTLLEAGETLTVRGSQNIKNFRAFRTGGTSGSLKVQFAF